MAGKLPDIPESLWIEDQQREYERTTQGIGPASDFDSWARELAANIPHDIGFPGGLSNILEEDQIAKERQRQEEDRKRREEEEQARQQELLAQQDQDMQRLQAQQDEHKQAQVDLSTQQGILTPDQFGDQLAGTEMRPSGVGSPNNTASMIFDSSYNRPLDSTKPLSPAEDFDQFAGGLNARAFGTSEPPSTPNQEHDFGKPVEAPDAQPGENIWDYTKRQAARYYNYQFDMYGRAGQTIADTAVVRHVKETFDDIVDAFSKEEEARAARERVGINPDLTPKARQDIEAMDQQRHDLANLFPENRVEGQVVPLDQIPNPMPEPTPAILPLPEETVSAEATSKARRAVSHQLLETAEDLIDTATGDPYQTRRGKDPWGVLDALGLTEGVTLGQVAANVLPTKILQLPQWVDIAGQVLEDPIGTTGGFAFFGALGHGLQKPAVQRVALSIIGGLAGGIDAYLNQRNWVGDDTTGVWDVGAEAASGVVAGFRAPKTLPPFVRLIKNIATSPSMGEALHKLDVLAGKSFDASVATIRSKFPGIADALNPNVSEDMAGAYMNRTSTTAQDTATEFLSAAATGPALRQMTTGSGVVGTAIGGIEGAKAGWESVPEDAPLQTKMDAAVKGAIPGIILGGLGGAAAGRASVIGASKLIANAMENGRFLEAMADHPDSDIRIRAMMLAAARGLADNEIVQVPGGVGYELKFGDRTWTPEVEQLLQSGQMTAGEIRQQFANSPVEELGKALRDVVVDYITGIGGRERRNLELGADVAESRGLGNAITDSPFLRIQFRRDRGKVEGVDTIELPPDEPVHTLITNITDEWNIPRPRIFVKDAPNGVNAAAYRETGSMPIINIDSGLIDAYEASRINEDEFRSVLIHELAHATEADRGYGLLADARNFVDGLIGRVTGRQREIPSVNHPPARELAPGGPYELYPREPLPDFLKTPEVNPEDNVPDHWVRDPDEISIRDWNQNPVEPMPEGMPETSPFERGKRSIPAHLQNTPTNQMLARPPLPTNIDQGLFERAYNWWTSKMTDNLERLQGYQDAIAKEFRKQTGALLPARMLIAEMKRFDASMPARLTIDTYMKPALKAFRELGLEDSAIDEYLLKTQWRDIARHQGNYASTGQANTNRQFPGGETYQSIDRWLNDFDAFTRTWSREDQKKFADATQSVWDLGNRNLETIRDAGLITDNVYNELRAAYPRYVPTQIVRHLQDNGLVGVGKSLSQRSSTINALTERGTTEDALSPLAAMVSATYKAHAAAQKNRIFNGFVGLWSEAEALRAVLPANPNRMPGWSAASDRVRNFADLIRVALPSTASDAEWRSVEGFVNGQKIKLMVHRDLGDVTKFDSPATIPVLSGLMAAFRATLTSRNPIFLTSNAFLDFTNYMIRETARDGIERPGLGSAAGAGIGSAYGALTTPSDATPEQRTQRVLSSGAMGAMAGATLGSYRVLGSYTQAIAQMVLSPQAWRDMARSEYRGDVARFLEQGGGYAGHSNVSGYRERPWIDPSSRTSRIEAALGRFMDSIGFGASSDAQGEIDRLRRNAANIPISLHTPGDVRGMIEVGNLREFIRFVTDVLTFKPVAVVGERIELAPRVAAMRNAERRSAPNIQRVGSAFDDEIAALTAYQVRGTPLPSRYTNAAGVPNRTLAEAIQSRNEAVADAQIRSRIEGTQAGRTVTIDFNKGGTWSKFINNFIPFFNVGVQAATDPTRAMRENPTAFATTVLASSLIPMYLAEAYNNRNEQTRADYDDVPQALKDQGLVLMLPREAPVDDYGNRHPQFLHIRYRQFAPMAMLTREFLQSTLFRKDNPAYSQRNALQILGAALESQSPVTSTGPTDTAMSLVQPLVGTALQLGFNQDTFRQRAIVSKGNDERASPLSKALAARFAYDDYSSHPSYWDFLTRDTLGGVANTWHGASEILYGDKQKTTPQDIPVVGGLYSRFVKGSIGEGAEQARENVTPKELYTALNRNGISWRPSPLDPVIQDVPLTRVEGAKYQRAANQLTMDLIRELEADPKWVNQPPEVKTKYLQDVRDRRMETVRQQIIHDIPAPEWNRRRGEALTKKRGY